MGFLFTSLPTVEIVVGAVMDVAPVEAILVILNLTASNKFVGSVVGRSAAYAERNQ
jgi:hypothetical protein